ncbi:MAG: hypothetical protein ACW964_07255 [Candidatus Hodarchaeales archaeon]|jgi:hypothetical protein
MVKKKLGFYSFILLILFVPIFSVAAEDGYVLITYFEFDGDLPSPGDTVTIKAELYRTGNRVTESVEIQIDYISSTSNTGLTISMVKDGNGIFSYLLTISIDESDNNIYLGFSAFVDNVKVADDNLNINLSNEEEEDLFRPMNSISHQFPMPGDVVEVTTYIPGVADGTIDVSEPTITVQFHVSGSISDTSEVTSSNVGNGFYSATYTIPTGFSLNIEDGTPRLNIDIKVDSNGKTYWDGFYLIIGGLRVFTKSSLTDSSLTVDVLVLGDDYLPVEDATVTASIHLRKSDSASEIIDVFLPNTDSEGRSTQITVIDITDLYYIETSVIVTESDWFGQGNTYLSLDTDYSYGYFSVYPDEDYIKDLLTNYDKGAYFNMIAMSEGKPLGNTPIEVYARWTQGVIEARTITTDQNGRFKIEIDWPADIDQEFIQIDFVYYNGTEWFYSEFSTSKAPGDLSVNSGTKPKITYADYADYQTATITYQLPAAAPVGLIYSMAIYEGSLLYSTISQETTVFIDNSGIMGNNFAKPVGSNIYTQNVIDLAVPLKYLVIMIQYPEKNAESGIKFVIWLIDSEGNTVGTGSPALQNLTGFDAIALGLILLSMISITYLKGRKKFN